MLPLLFVCKEHPASANEASRTEFLTCKSPDGPVYQAFESHELAAGVMLLFGAAKNVFLLPETHLTPAEAQHLTGAPVLIYREAADYQKGIHPNPEFPWADRVIRYDPNSRAVRGVTQAE